MREYENSPVSCDTWTHAIYEQRSMFHALIFQSLHFMIKSLFFSWIDDRDVLNFWINQLIWTVGQLLIYVLPMTKIMEENKPGYFLLRRALEIAIGSSGAFEQKNNIKINSIKLRVKIRDFINFFHYYP